mmetsp:Transcript_19350/g.41994  ORF Transcript_19350/g.41994 Transcript_19350/m.41994 type:complete len:92 (+) Transcript_19350:35-310(+)
MYRIVLDSHDCTECLRHCDAIEWRLTKTLIVVIATILDLAQRAHDVAQATTPPLFETTGSNGQSTFDERKEEQILLDRSTFWQDSSLLCLR